MRVLLVKVGEESKELNVSNTLDNLRLMIGGGYIEIVQVAYDPDRGHLMSVICDEEGRLKNLPFNRRFKGADFYGDFVIVRDDSGNFKSLTKRMIKSAKEDMNENF